MDFMETLVKKHSLNPEIKDAKGVNNINAIHWNHHHFILHKALMDREATVAIHVSLRTEVLVTPAMMYLKI